MSNSRIVVTGIGASSPLGGTAPESWSALLEGVSGARTLEHDWVEKYQLPVTFAAEAKVRPDTVLERPDRQAPRSVVAVRARRGDGGVGRRRQPRDRPGATRRRLRHRHRRAAHPARRVGHAAREGSASRSADDGPHAHAERRGRKPLPPLQRPRLRAHRRQRLRVEHRVDRQRDRAHPRRLRRRRDRRRHRVRHPPGDHRRVLVDAGALPSQRRPRDARRGRAASTATASSWARARPC